MSENLLTEANSNCTANSSKFKLFVTLSWIKQTMFLIFYPSTFFLFSLLDPQPWLKGSYEIGSARLSFHPSVLPSVRFLRIGSLVFSETWHGVRGPYIVVCDRARFSWKSPRWAKMTKNSQKWPKNMIFWSF